MRVKTQKLYLFFFFEYGLQRVFITFLHTDVPATMIALTTTTFQDGCHTMKCIVPQLQKLPQNRYLEKIILERSVAVTTFCFNKY